MCGLFWNHNLFQLRVKKTKYKIQSVVAASCHFVCNCFVYEKTHRLVGKLCLSDLWNSGSQQVERGLLVGLGAILVGYQTFFSLLTQISWNLVLNVNFIRRRRIKPNRLVLTQLKVLKRSKIVCYSGKMLIFILSGPPCFQCWEPLKWNI